MVKKFCFFTLFLLTLHAQNVDPYLQTIFDHLKVKTTLEFGMGQNTPYFLQNSGKVISIEFITHGYGPENMKGYLEKNREFSNWIPIAFFSGFHGDMNWAPYRYYGSERNLLVFTQLEKVLQNRCGLYRGQHFTSGRSRQCTL
jgi:hypothetical protein